MRVCYVLICCVGLVCADARQKLQDALDAKEKERANLANQVLQLEKQLEVAKVGYACARICEYTHTHIHTYIHIW